MAVYETGSASALNDLLDKFYIFAGTQGWTIDSKTANSMTLHKGSAFFSLRMFTNETAVINGGSAASKYGIGVSGSDSYNGAVAWDLQPGHPTRGSSTGGIQGHAFMPLVTALPPFPAYHFFAPDSKTLYCELEIRTGVFKRFGFGSMDLFSSSAPGSGRFFYATGGKHVTNATTGSVWLGEDMDLGSRALELVPFRFGDIAAANGGQGSFVRVASGSFDNWACSGWAGDTNYQAMSCAGGGMHDKPLRELAKNPLNNMVVLLPNIVSLNISNTYLSPIGVVPGIRYMDMTNYIPGQEFTLGSDTWKVFPWYQQGGLSAQRGIAYKKA
jgi:hypothetical protein